MIVAHHAMRSTVLCLILLLLASSISVAAAQPNSCADADDHQQSDVEFLRKLSKDVEKAGFKNVEVIPQMFLVKVDRPEGTTTTLVVDSVTGKAVEISGALDFLKQDLGSSPETTAPGAH
jgi:hypothetical protein